MTFETVYKIGFCLSVLGVVYSYFIYPCLLFAFSWVKRHCTAYHLAQPKQLVHPKQSDAYKPSVAVVIAAFNEEKHILNRIKNLLAQDYDQALLTIYIGSDGSDDNTCELIASLAHPRVKLFDFQQRRGKVAILNDLIDVADQQLIVMTDANTEFSVSAISCLVRHFDDISVGAVCGELDLVKANSCSGNNINNINNKDDLYWRYEQFLKQHEAVLGGLLGANGGIYAFRRSLYQALPSDTIVDDFIVVMRIALLGYQVVYDHEASATEDIAPSLDDEYRRRVRIGMGNYQALVRLPAALDPRQGWLWFTYLSHKVGRWFVPHALFMALILSFMLRHEFLYALALLLQVSIYVLVWIAPHIFTQRHMPSLVSIMSFFIKMNLALAHGFIKWCQPGGSGIWNRTPR